MSKTVFSLERIDDHLLWLENYIREKKDLAEFQPSPFCDAYIIHFLDNIHSMLVDYEDYVKHYGNGG